MFSHVLHLTLLLPVKGLTLQCRTPNNT